jgi:NADH-quinone oxidoreductase subunit E
VRTASRRARRLGTFLLLAAGLLWAFVRRRTGTVVWAEPLPSTPREPGPPGELPGDVLATDAGLTPLPTPAPPAPAPPAPAPPAPAAGAAPPAGPAAPADATAERGTAASGPEAAAAAGPEAAAAAGPAPEVAGSEAVPEVAGAAEDAAGAGTDVEIAGPGDGVDEPTDVEIAARVVEAEAVATDPEAAGSGVDGRTMTLSAGADEVAQETGDGIPLPTFSEAPTMEMPAVTDNLQALRGIGPSMERMLHNLGIVTFRQLAMLDGAELERVRAELSEFRTRIEREDWVGQARTLYREKYGRDPS